MAKDVNMLALISVLSTILIPLVVPLVIIFAKKDDKYAVYYSKQVVVLSLVSFIAMIISAVLMIVLIGFLLLPIIGLATLILYVLLIINVLSGEQKPLPVIGNLWK